MYLDRSEMWDQGDKVAYEVITPDTKVVFRSTTVMVHLLIQMNSEMWDVDITYYDAKDLAELSPHMHEYLHHTAIHRHFYSHSYHMMRLNKNS